MIIVSRILQCKITFENGISLESILFMSQFCQNHYFHTGTISNVFQTVCCKFLEALGRIGLSDPNTANAS